jgi:hypothetical protein
MQHGSSAFDSIRRSNPKPSEGNLWTDAADFKVFRLAPEYGGSTTKIAIRREDN